MRLDDFTISFNQSYGNWVVEVRSYGPLLEALRLYNYKEEVNMKNTFGTPHHHLSNKMAFGATEGWC